MPRPLSAGTPGVLHGNRTYLLQDANGQIIETHSVSAGLDYPGVGPEHSWLKDSGRAEYVSINDDEALAAFHNLCHYEGIIPALESSHALAHAAKLAPTHGEGQDPAGQSFRTRRQGHAIPSPEFPASSSDMSRMSRIRPYLPR
jgi:tryptophan synthase beta subunit